MRHFIKPLTAFLLCLSAVAFAERPNVILIMTDDQGYGDFGATGNKLIRTPNIDAMAQRSAMMTQFHVSPVCSPTRAALMTGRYNYRTRVVDTWIGRSMMEPEEVTIAEMLSAAGYATGIFGKWHLGDSYPMRPIDQGFQEALVHRGGGLAQPADHPENNDRYTDPWLYHNGEPVKTEGYCTDVYFRAAMEYIGQQAAADKPFFTYIAMNAPHGPFHDVPEDLRLSYQDVPLETLNKVPLPEKRVAAEKDMLERIAAMITNVDDNMGKLFVFLDEKGLTENTLVIFLTDNGPNTNRYAGPFRGMKSYVHDGGVRTPIWFQWPGHLAAGTKSDRIAAHIDVTPTILDACGVETSNTAKFDGRSLLPLLEGKSPEWPDRTLTLQSHRGPAPQRYHNFMTRDQRWKLVNPSGFGKLQMDGPPQFELYDLENDPGETTNLADKHPEILARLKKAYEDWFDDVSSTRPDNYAPPIIQVGTPHERVTAFTRQDWLAEAWGENAPGHWVGDFKTGGNYTATVHLYPRPNEGTLTLRVGGVVQAVVVEANARSAEFGTLNLPAGEHKIEAYVDYGETEVHANQIDLALK